MPASRGVVVLGMHRAGTSLVTRGIKSLGIYMGDDFVDPQFDNPRGYWEDRHIEDLNQRVLRLFGLKWESPDFLTDTHWAAARVRGHATGGNRTHPGELLITSHFGVLRIRGQFDYSPSGGQVLERLGVRGFLCSRYPESVERCRILDARQPDVFDACPGTWPLACSYGSIFKYDRSKSPLLLLTMTY